MKNQNHSVEDDRPAVARFYKELRALTGHYLAKERKDHTLQPTALAHEVFVRLAGQSGADQFGRTQFLSLASEMIRRILVDYARKRGAVKRGGGRFRVAFDELNIPEAGDDPIDVLDLDLVLTELAALNPRQARIVELRFFGGLSIDETADALHISRGTVKGDWRIARAWLRVRLGKAQ